MTIKLNVRDKLEDDTLDLSLCDLQEVPVREIASVRRATTVDLSNNQLVTLPKNFVTLTQIVKLDLSKNMLIEIPENFGEMRQLKHLDLYGNQISRLPLSLGDLKNLKWLDLKDNPLTPAVATVAGPCSNASDCQACARNIVAYLSNAREKIEEEKQRRSIAAAAATAAAVSAETLGKKEAKKKKKKPNAEKLNNKDTSNLQQIELEQRKTTFCNDEKFQRQHRFNDESSNTAGAIGVLFRAFFWIIMWLLFLGILVFLGLSVFFTYDEQRSKQFLEYAESQTGLPMKHYKELGVKIAKDAMDNVRLWSGEAQNVIFDACTRYFGTKRNKNEL